MELPFWDDAAALAARGNFDGNCHFATPDRNSLDSNVLCWTLEEAGMPQRLINYMSANGCKYLGQLVQWTAGKLLDLPNLGVGTVTAAETVLRLYNLQLGMTLPDWRVSEADEREQQLLLEPEAPDEPKTSRRVASDVPEEVLLATLEELGLPKRFLTQLPTNKFKLVGQLIQRSEAELLALPNVGRKSLWDARATLGTFGLAFGLEVPAWDDQRALLRREALGSRIRQRLFELRGEQAALAVCLEDEVCGLFERVETGRNVQMLCSLLGFDGEPPKTLETVGQAHGLTRERVRQIADRAKRRLSTKWFATPRLDAALDILSREEPAQANVLSSALLQSAVTRMQVHPQAVLEAAELVDKPVPVRRAIIGRDELYCSPANEELVRQATRELRRATSATGYPASGNP